MKGVRYVTAEVLRRGIPMELQTMNQWVLIRVEEGEDGKQKKVPYQIRNIRSPAKTNSPCTWGSFENGLDRLKQCEGYFATLGFVLSSNDPYMLIDLDKVVSDNKNVTDEARRMIELLSSYTEESLSGTGLHVLVKAVKPYDVSRRKNHEWLEVYDHSRLVTMTGIVPDPNFTVIRAAQDEVEQIYKEYFPVEPSAPHLSEVTCNSELSNDEVLRLARSGACSEKFNRLWIGNTSDYKDDTSSADMAFCCILAGITRDPDQIDALYRQSGLAREKWDSRRGSETYGQNTIKKALCFVAPTHLPTVVTNNRYEPRLHEETDSEMQALTEDALEIDSPIPLPIVVTNNKQERELTEDVIRVMQGPTCRRFFNRGNTLCTIINSDNEGPSIVDLNEDSLLGFLNDAADWVEYSGKEFRPTKLNRRIISIILGKTEMQGFHPLDGLATAPFLRADGTICEDHGYDARSRKYLFITGQDKFRSVPDNPSSDDVAQARQMLEELFFDFPFDCDASRANAIAYLLTPSVMSVINTETPIALLDASTQGSGKSLICKCCGMIYTGVQPDLTTPPVREEEWKKTIMSLLIGGNPLIIFDNAERHIDSEALHAVLTSTRYGGRILGVSEYRSYPNHSVWALTGNNLNLSPDLSRRGYWIRLIPKTSRPQNRTEFKHPSLLEWIQSRRSDYLWAILTLGRAWFSAGCPKPTTHTLGGFEKWSTVVGGILENAGIRGFLSNSEDLWSEANSETQSWEQFVQVLYSKHKDSPIKTVDIYMMITDYPDFFASELPYSITEAVANGSETTCVSKLGKALRKVIHRRFGPAGIYLTRGTRTCGTNPWCLKVEYPEFLPDNEITPTEKPTDTRSMPLPLEDLLKKDF